ncbi:hypothetical protein [Paraburkholderia adhaesiva]|uniref:hypothetical protein n=1 Tax=Paraburkholderia adhaesiva TaxID=2883244 RepID=UPI001F1FDBB2|nr:hypothetical protein [Paraburkholderia adhaesiva]
MSVDLPTFGRPTIATMPQRKPAGVEVGAFMIGPGKKYVKCDVECNVKATLGAALAGAARTG